MEEEINIFYKLLCDLWHGCNTMEEVTLVWFAARVKEFQYGHNIDLICAQRRLRDNDSKIDLSPSNHLLNFHGYNLKNILNC